MHLPFRVLLYRYLFFAWLFQDMSVQRSMLARAAAWRHNQAQSRWLPLYMLRYTCIAASLMALGSMAEPLSPVLSACFFVPGTMTVAMFTVAGVSWMGLQWLE